MNTERISRMRATTLLLLPSVLPDERNKPARAVLFDLRLGFGFDHSHQLLRLSRGADGNYEAASHFQLGHERIGNARPAGSYQNRIVWPMAAPSQRSVESFHSRVVDSQ